MKYSSAILLENAHQTAGEFSVHISKYDENLGELTILLEIRDAGEETKKIIKHIIEDSEYHYFHSIAREPEKALEDALQKVNLGISETLKHTKNDWLSHSSLLIAACCNGEVHFAKVHSISAFLISRDNGSDEIIQITENALSEAVNPVKVFSNIYSGTLTKDSAILFVSDSILDYVSQEKLRKISIDNSPKEAISELKTILKKAPGTKMFGAVICKAVDDEETVPIQKGKDVVKHELRTIKPIAQSLKVETPEKEPEIQHIKNIAHLYQKSGKKPGSRDGKSFMNKKIVLAIVIALIIIVVGVKLIGFLKTDNNRDNSEKNQTQVAIQTFEENVALIQATFIEAQNDLIVDKKEEAKQSLLQISALVSALPEDAPEHVREKRLLEKKVKTQILLAEGVGLTNATLVAELTGISATDIIRKDDDFFLIDTLSGDFHHLSVSSPQPIKLDVTTAGEIGKISRSIDETGDGIILYHELGTLAELQIQKKTIKALEWNRGWKGAPLASEIYQNKLYVVAPENKIFKYSSSITGFTQETSWLKEGSAVSLDDATDLAIDSTLWVLKQNGEILKFFKGAREPFSFTISPPLTKPVKLFTDLDLKYLYILDAGTNRIVILEKDGELLTQLTAEEFSHVKDFAVDEGEKKIYVLDQGAVFMIKF